MHDTTAPLQPGWWSGRLDQLAASEQPTVGAYLRGWLEHMRGRVRATTHDGYESLIRRRALPTIGPILLNELHPLHLQDLYGQLVAPRTTGGAGLSGGSVRNLHLVLNQALAQAVRWRLITTNPAAGTQPPRPRRPLPLVVDPPLLRRILTAADGDPLEPIIAIAASTGMRRGEILALRWSDITTDHSQLHIRRTLQSSRAGLNFEHPKTSRSRRTVALPAYLQPYLERQQARQAARREKHRDWHEHGLVIDSGNGNPIHPDTLSSGWRRFLHRHQLPQMRFHDLRHAHATLMLQQGVHPKIVSERLGHASISITLDTYSHVLPTMQTQASDAFDRLFRN
jgi:integrase